MGQLGIAQRWSPHLLWRFPGHRTNPRIVNLLLALAPEQVLLEPPESESSRDKERQTSTYLIVSCHIFIPLHTQTGVKFEMGNITDLFWEQRPRLGCAGALFFKFYFDARAQSSSAIGLALNPHTHRHTHTLVCISGLFGSASLLAFQVECLYSASASKRRPFMSSVLRDSNRTQLPNFLLVKEKSIHPKWVRTGIKTTAGRRYWDDSWR